MWAIGCLLPAQPVKVCVNKCVVTYKKPLAWCLQEERPVCIGSIHTHTYTYMHQTHTQKHMSHRTKIGGKRGGKRTQHTYIGHMHRSTCHIEKKQGGRGGRKNHNTRTSDAYIEAHVTCHMSHVTYHMSHRTVHELTFWGLLYSIFFFWS